MQHRRMRSPTRWILLGMFLFGGLPVMALVAVALLRDPVDDASVLHLRLEGELPETPSLELSALLKGREPMTLRTVTRTLRRAAQDPKVVGLILDVRGPTLGAAGLQEFEEGMAAFRKSGKMNVAFLETTGELQRGDHAYAVAATADRIVLAPSGEIGLIGLRAEIPFLKGTFEKLGVGVHVEQRHAYKNAANIFTQEDFTPEHRESVAGILSDVQAQTIDYLALRRHVDAATVKGWLEAGPHGSASALENRLVDELAYWDTVLAQAEKTAGHEDALFDFAAYAGARPPKAEGPRFAVIFGEGQVTRGESAGGINESTMGSDTLTQALRDAREDKVRGVLLRVNSPGGSYIASDVMYREVVLTRAAGIPVVVSMGNVAASGGYFVAMPANRIIAQPGTLTGSIGVFAGHLALRDLYRKLGVTYGVIDTSPASGSYTTLDNLTPLQSERFKQTVDRIYHDFVSKAAEQRGKSYDDMHALAQGRVWTGREAQARGLVDELGGFELAVTRLRELAELPPDTPLTLAIYPPPKEGLALLLDFLGSSVAAAKEVARITALLRTATSADPPLLAPLPQWSEP